MNISPNPVPLPINFVVKKYVLNTQIIAKKANSFGFDIFILVKFIFHCTTPRLTFSRVIFPANIVQPDVMRLVYFQFNRPVLS